MSRERSFTDEIGLQEMELQDNEYITYRHSLRQISHDLRTPAAVLKSNIDLIRKFHYHLDTGTVEESIGACQSSLEKMINFLDKIQFLNISLLSNLKPVYTQFKVKKLIQKLLTKEELNPYKKRIKIIWNLNVPYACTDYNFLQQILIHLLSNAFKFSHNEVILTIENTAESLILTIKDFGCGIPENEKKMIFDPFYHCSNTQDIAGAGLGLTMVKSLIRALDADIYLSSSVDYGTSMKVIIKNS